MASKENNQISKELIKCAVKNCNDFFNKEDGMKIGDEIYCKICGTQIITQSFVPF